MVSAPHIGYATLAVLTERFRDSAETDGDVVALFLEITAATLRAEVERPNTLQ